MSKNKLPNDLQAAADANVSGAALRGLVAIMDAAARAYRAGQAPQQQHMTPEGNA